ncbi:MAG: sporulation protein YunB [Oscillospiraceae bacterium]|nr:sporulation protein YunB [Oscillospiraceae bacterium]
MRRRQRRKISPAARIFSLSLGLLLLILAGLLLYYDVRLAPVAQSVAGHQAKVAAIRRINNAMLAVMDEEGAGYGDIVKISRGADGKVQSLQSDMVLVNRLKLKAADRIMEEVSQPGGQSVRIPLGNLFGIQLLAGRGPDIEIKAIPVGYVQTRLHNQFTSAGINQTNHRIMLEAGLQVLVVLPGYTREVTVMTDYCVAETVIVGETPDTFAGIHLDSAPAWLKIDA